MSNLEKSWQERIAEEKEKSTSSEHIAFAKQRQKMAHMWNLNEDPALTDVIVHFIPNGKVTSLLFYIIENLFKGADIFINGRRIFKETELQQNDR
uniref:Galectin n=1 Tax=Heterorhabditis bacteriophora TaxID=37862 RepID=A0A1I7WJZ8_HETBA